VREELKGPKRALEGLKGQAEEETLYTDGSEGREA